MEQLNLDHLELSALDLLEFSTLDDIDTLRFRVADLAIAPVGNSWSDQSARCDAIYEIASNALVTEGLSAEDKSSKSLALINGLYGISDFQSRDHRATTGRDSRRTVAEVVWQNAETIARLAENSSDSETAGLAQQVILKTLCAPAPYYGGFSRDAEQQLHNAMRHTLASALAANQEDVSGPLSAEQLELVTSSLLTRGTAEDTRETLEAINRAIHSNPEAVPLAQTMQQQAAAHIGGEVPRSTSEFTYKLCVARFIEELGWPDNSSTNTALRDRITELDETGQATGWNADLWDKIASRIQTTGGQEHDGAIAAMLLARYGLQYETLHDAWKTECSYAPGTPEFSNHHKENLARIITLEEARPGATRVLNAPPYRMRNFARVPLDALINQYDYVTGRRGGSHAFVGLGIYDYNNFSAPVYEQPLWQNLSASAAEHEITPLFHEGNAAQLLFALANTRKYHGDAAEFAIGKFHNGLDGRPYVGGMEGSRNAPTQAQISELAKSETLRDRLRNAVKPLGEICILGCWAGLENNTAQTLSRVMGGTAIGAANLTNGAVEDSITLFPHAQGTKLSLTYRQQDGPPVSSRRYRNGFTLVS